MKHWKQPNQPSSAPPEGTPGSSPEASSPVAEPSPLDPPQGKVEGAGAATAAGPVQISREEYEGLLQKANERDLYRNELLRNRADFDNYQKRVQKEKPQIADQALRRFALDILPVLDNFDRALGGEDATVESIRSGILIVRGLLLKALREHGFEEIEALGRPFDPVLHEAVVHEETVAHPPGTVSDVLTKGYLHHGMVVRPAHVKVARAPVVVPDSLPEEEFSAPGAAEGADQAIQPSKRTASDATEDNRGFPPRPPRGGGGPEN